MFACKSKCDCDRYLQVSSALTTYCKICIWQTCPSLPRITPLARFHQVSVYSLSLTELHVVLCAAVGNLPLLCHLCGLHDNICGLLLRGDQGGASGGMPLHIQEALVLEEVSDHVIHMSPWAARYTTWLLFKLVPKGVVLSFLFFSTHESFRVSHHLIHMSHSFVSSFSCQTHVFP